MRRLAVLVGSACAVVALAGAGSSAGSSDALAPAYKRTRLAPGMAWGINDRGQVVGTLASGNAFVWANGKMTDFGTLGVCCGSEARAINDRGQVVGNCFANANGSPSCHAFLWENGEMTALFTLDQAFGINDRGQVVGTSNQGNGTSHAALWENGETIDLGTLGGCCNTGPISSEARGINNRGQVVGSSYTAGPDTTGLHGFLWEDGVMTDLGSLGADASGRVWVTAVGINESGQVVGQSTGYDAAGPQLLPRVLVGERRHHRSRRDGSLRNQRSRSGRGKRLHHPTGRRDSQPRVRVAEREDDGSRHAAQRPQ